MNGYKKRVYVASGWFTPHQKETYDKLHNELLLWEDSFEFFFPKEQSSDLQFALDQKEIRQEVFNRNLTGMASCDLMICATEDKDTGSIFEAGFAFALGRPIVFVNYHLGNAPFNLMLTESALAIVREDVTLKKVLERIVRIGLNDRKAFEDCRQEETAE